MRASHVGPPAELLAHIDALRDVVDVLLIAAASTAADDGPALVGLVRQAEQETTKHRSDLPEHALASWRDTYLAETARYRRILERISVRGELRKDP